MEHRMTAQRDGSSFVLNGIKTWVSASPVADLAIVWAEVHDITTESTALKIKPPKLC